MVNRLTRRLIASKDFYLALFTMILGLVCLNEAQGFEGDARAFPFYISLALVLLGVIQLVQVLLDASERHIDREAIHAVVFGALPLAGVAVLWAWALSSNLGYVLPTIIASIALLTVLKFGSWSMRISRALLITAIIFVLFYIIFGSPLPTLELVDDFFVQIDQFFRD